MMRTALARLTVAAVLASALAACGVGSLKVTGVQLGRSLNSDNSVGAHTTGFAPDDTIYVSVLSEGPGKATLAARWLYAGRLVSEDHKEVSYTREAATEFHIHNSSGFPKGDYEVEILVNGERWGARPFKVG